MTLDHPTQFLAGLLAPGMTAETVQAQAGNVRPHDMPDPLDGVILEAIRAAAANGLSGGACVLSQLQDDGHLARDIDRRIGDRLAALITTPAEPLQARHHAQRILEAAEVRVVQSWAADAIERGHRLSHDELREMERELWRRLRDVHERLDAMRGTSRPDRLEVAA